MRQIFALLLFILTTTLAIGQTKPADFDKKLKDQLKLYEKVYNTFTDRSNSKAQMESAFIKFKEIFDGTNTYVWNDLDTGATNVDFVKASDYFKSINQTFRDGHQMQFNLNGAKIGEMKKNFEQNSLTTEVSVKKKITFESIVTVVDSVRFDSTRNDTIKFTHLDTVQKSIIVPYVVHFKYDIEQVGMVKIEIYGITRAGIAPKFKPLKGDDKWWVDLDKAWKDYFIQKLKMPEIPDKYDFGKLSSLTKLDLTKESFLDLSPLEKLTGLKKLYLNGTNISDIGPIKNLKNLRELDISETKVTDLSALESLTRLEILKCNKLGLKSLDGIKNMTNLIELEVRENEIENIDPVKNFTKLERIDFSLNLNISSIEPLRGLENLTDVIFVKMKVKDLSPLSKCTNLVELNCFNNEITSLAPIRSCYKLTRLNIGYNKIYSLDELSGMKYIIDLGLQGAPVEDISVLRNFTNLQQLDLSETFATDLGPVMNCEEILTLKAINSKIPKGDIARFKKKYPKCRIYYY